MTTTGFNPDMLDIALDLRAVTTAQAAEACNIDAARLAQARVRIVSLTGPHYTRITKTEIERLAVYLNLPAAFFYREGRRLPVWGRLCSGYDEDDES